MHVDWCMHQVIVMCPRRCVKASSAGFVLHAAEPVQGFPGHDLKAWRAVCTCEVLMGKGVCAVQDWFCEYAMWDVGKLTPFTPSCAH